ncbi:MAG: hypothetical protein KF878_17355 [Planctomycetes bacterium]|nr:hypothetical protein [Planctomycetota bacterium]
MRPLGRHGGLVQDVVVDLGVEDDARDARSPSHELRGFGEVGGEPPRRQVPEGDLLDDRPDLEREGLVSVSLACTRGTCGLARVCRRPLAALRGAPARSPPYGGGRARGPPGASAPGVLWTLAQGFGGAASASLGPPGLRAEGAAWRGL